MARNERHPRPTRAHVLTLRSQSGFEGLVIAAQDDIRFIPSDEEDETVTEAVTLKVAGSSDVDHTRITLQEPLDNVWDRMTVTIHANVVATTHGETVEEVLGSGDASQSYQSFTLKQPPLTHVSAATPSGRESTLEVRVNDVLRHEVSTLLGSKPEDRVW